MFYFFFITQSKCNICEKGLIFTDVRNSFLNIKLIASYTGKIWDPVFKGSFCPKKNGNYRMIFEGYYNTNYEPIVGQYGLNFLLTNSRTTSYYQLNSNICYPFYAKQSNYPDFNGWGNLYFQLEGTNKFLLNSSNSFSCYDYLCLNGNQYPNCGSSINLKLNLNFLIILLNFIIF